MKIFIFLTLISLGSPTSILETFSDAQSTINELTSLQTQTFSAAISDTNVAISQIAEVLGSGSQNTVTALQGVLDRTVVIADSIVNTLISAIQANGDADVQSQATTALEQANSGLTRQIQEFQQTANQGATSDQQSQINTIVQTLTGQLNNDFTPIFQAITQLTQ